MPVSAMHLVRKMRGGAQAHLLQCDDGHCYVVKFCNNSQHPRILINEWISSAVLCHLQISTPRAELVNLSEEFLSHEPDVYIQLGSRRLEVQPGWHFGSRYPGDPSKMMVYDFLPDTMLERVVNKNDLLGVLVFDKWAANGDARQAIFCRKEPQQGSVFADTSRDYGFVAHMIDHGYMFGGPYWSFGDSPLQGLYFRPTIYKNVRSLNDFQPWLDAVLCFSEDVLDEARRQIPPEWLIGEQSALDALLAKLMSRRRRVPELIWEATRCSVNPFPSMAASGG